jgi:hypothetical protein
MAVEWSNAEDLKPYRGIFKVLLLPPDDLFLPVIAEKIHGKLVGAIVGNLIFPGISPMPSMCTGCALWRTVEAG